MSQHTPGPWIYDIHEHSFYIFTAADMEMVADGDPDDKGIARMRGTGRGADEHEQEANAQLIAAAPELRDVAEALLLFYSVDWDEQKRTRWTALTGEVEATTKILCNFARKAIAKAEGAA